ATIAALLATGVGARLAIGWLVGAVASAAGLGAAWAWDLPTGAAVVSAFGGAIGLVALGLGVRRAMRAFRERGTRALIPAAFAAGLLIVAAGAFLAAFPRMDQPWLDLAERIAP